MSLSLDERRRRLGLPDPSTLLTLNVIHTPKVYAYIRVSTDKQEKDGVSLDVQQEQITNHCRLLQLPPPDIVSDPALSGRFMDNRPKFQEMCSKLRPGDTIITYSLSRLARNTKEFLSFVDRLKSLGVRLICIKESFDLNYEHGEISATSQLMLSMMASIAEFEANQTRERTKAALDKLRADGKLRTKPHFGWTYVTSPDKVRTLIEVPDEQAVINFLLLSISNNKNISVADLTRLLNLEISQGRLSFRGKPHVNHSQVSRIISHNNLRG